MRLQAAAIPANLMMPNASNSESVSFRKLGALPMLDSEPTKESHPRKEVRRVMVVDDLEDSAVSLSQLLQVLGFESRPCTSGFQAIEEGTHFGPDAIVLDLGMPGMDGFETAQHVQQEEWGRKALLIALTGWGAEEDFARTRRAGFHAHLVKPLNLPDLLDLLGNKDS